MKKSTKYIMPLLVICLFMVSMAITPTKPVIALPTGCPVTGIYITFQGWPSGGGAMLTIKTSLELDYANDTNPIIISMTQDSFSELDEKPSNFKTDGITPTYSDSVGVTSSGLHSTKGIYQTFARTSELSYTQHDYGRHTQIYTYSTTEPFHTTITDFMKAIDPSYTYLNFIPSAIDATLIFDKPLVDNCLLEAKARPQYQEIADDPDLTTDVAFVENLLDEVLGNHISGITYASFNVTAYPTNWTPAQEVRAVLGGNSTDSSINGTVEIIHMRNALYGHIGQHKAGTDIIGQGLTDPIVDPLSPIWGFQQSATAYSVNYNILSDFAGSPTIANYTALFGLFVPSEAQIALGKDIWFWGDSAIIATCVALAVMLVAIFWAYKTKQKNKWLKILIISALAWFIVFVILLIATKQVYMP